MEGFPNSQASTQGWRETQEVASLSDYEAPDTENVWGRLLSVRENVSVYNLSKNSYTFGRGDADHQFTKDHFDNALLPAISKIHFRVSRETNTGNEVVLLEDLSCNGTFVNKKQVGRGKKVVLQNNDEISLAHANKKVFVFYDCLQNDESSYPPELTQFYTMSKKLGEGTFGEVRLAYKQDTLERCAVKILKKKGSQIILNNINTINNEIKLLQSVDHPCIIKLQNVIDTPEKIYIVMELAEGGELFDRLASNRRLPESTVKFYFYQVALAVQYLHRKNITHRDIKPENVLLGTDEEFTRVKLTDFGLSKFAADASQMTTFCGTPTYIAPELLDFGPLSYTSRVDMWSLGVLLFVSLAGYPPFHADNDGMLRYRIKNAVFDFHHNCWQEVSEEAKDLIRKLLVSNPNERLDIERALKHPWLQDTAMQRKALDLINQDSRLISPQRRKRALEEDSNDREDEGVDLNMPDSKTPKIQLTTMNKW
ncbi:serine/threonine-protein kinase Chk2-like [Penaeus japonicus]|uniref:serine/threonine-protein kinase Chk2-like n=1 Tax=Penaeus japonicus TaxID=27405 RepID=UPI001C71677F|nr:serine/threonine-protein kinase Chk2-like [Penaeus japonicus]